MVSPISLGMIVTGAALATITWEIYTYSDWLGAAGMIVVYCGYWVSMRALESALDAALEVSDVERRVP